MIRFIWHAPFYSGGGYSSEALAILYCLDKVQFPNLSISHHGDSYNPRFIDGLDDIDKDILQKYDNIPHESYSQITYVSICHSEPGAWSAPYPKYMTGQYPCPFHRKSYTKNHISNYNIGRTMFETDRIPSGWYDRFVYMDEIWVPTQFMKNIIVSDAIISEGKIKIIFEPVDTNFFEPKKLINHNNNSTEDINYENYNNIPNSLFNLVPYLFKNTTIFLFVGKFEKRKGIELLIHSYYQEFSNNDNVLLVILTNAYHSSDDFETEIQKLINKTYYKYNNKNTTNNNNIENINNNYIQNNLPLYMILTNIPQSDMPYLYSIATVLVVPSHGEGWGRPHIESMACGTPVIATNWSGPTQFIDDDNGYLISIEDELVDVENWIGHKWAQPKFNHIRSLLRYVHMNITNVMEKGEKARQDVIEFYSLEIIGKIITNEFKRIERKLTHLHFKNNEEL
eukprot:gene7191-9809_t